MKRLFLGTLGAVVVASTVAFASMGGWAVVSVMKIPDAWVAGKPLQLTWYVRQHGFTLLDNLHPTLEARSASRSITGTTWAFAENGQKGYRGTLTFPEPGVWQVTVNSGFGRSRAVLIPWRVVDSVTAVRGTVEAHLTKMGVIPLPDFERGRRLFAARGCVTCHTHAAVSIPGDVSDYGPNLTNLKFPPEYLARFLADPSIKPSTNGKRMPNLSLREKEITPLIAFINADHRQLTRR